MCISKKIVGPCTLEAIILAMNGKQNSDGSFYPPPPYDDDDDDDEEEKAAVWLWTGTPMRQLT